MQLVAEACHFRSSDSRVGVRNSAATWLMANDALCKLMSTRAGSFIACRRFAVILLGVVGLYACRSSLAMSAEAAGLKPGKDFTGRGN